MVKRVNRRKSVSKKGKSGISKSLRKRRQSRKKRGKGPKNDFKQKDFKQGAYVLIKEDMLMHLERAGMMEYILSDGGEHAIILQVINGKVIIGCIVEMDDFFISGPINPSDNLTITSPNTRIPLGGSTEAQLLKKAEQWWSKNPQKTG